VKGESPELTTTVAEPSLFPQFASTVDEVRLMAVGLVKEIAAVLEQPLASVTETE